MNEIKDKNGEVVKVGDTLSIPILDEDNWGKGGMVIEPVMTTGKVIEQNGRLIVEITQPNKEEKGYEVLDAIAPIATKVKDTPLTDIERDEAAEIKAIEEEAKAKAEAPKTKEKKYSHLSTLVERVKRMEEHIQDYEKEPDFQGRLLNIVEYMTYDNDWTKEEGEEAQKILDKYNFNVAFDHKAIEAKHFQMRGLPDLYRETCMRCGRHLTNKYSIQKGMGPFCRGKAAHGDWGKNDNPPQPGQAKISTLFGVVPVMGQSKVRTPFGIIRK